MHRSGTSFLARSFNLCGVSLGGLESLHTHEWHSHEDNPRGHWEHQELLDLADKTLEFNKGSWEDIPKKISLSNELGKNIKNSIKKLVEGEILGSGFKDPRMIFCFDTWSKFFPHNFVVVGIIRNPLKVAESLKKRNNFTYDKSLNLWKIYNQKLLEILDKNDGFLLDFDWPEEKLLNEIKYIAKKLGFSSNIDLSEWYTKDLFRSDKTYKTNHELPLEIKLLYEKLQKRTNNNAKVKIKFKPTVKELHESLNKLLKENQKQGVYFKKFLNLFEDKFHEKKNQLEYLQEEFDERTKWANSLESDLEQKTKQLTKLQEEFDERTNWANSLESDLEQKTKQLTTQTKSLESDLEQKTKQLTKLQEEFDERTNWANSLESDLEQKTKQLTKLQEEFDERTNWANSLESDLEQKTKQLTKLQEEFDERTNWANSLESDLEQKTKQLTTQTNSLESDLEQKTKQLTKLQEEFDERTNWANSLESDLEQKTKQLTKLQEEFDERTNWANSLESDLEQKTKQLTTQTNSLESDLEQKTKQLTKLQEEFDERTNWANSLESDLEQKTKQLTTQTNSLESDLEQKTKQLTKLQEEFDERTNWANSLESDLEQNIQQNDNLKNAIDTKDSQIDDLQYQLDSTRKKLEEIENSVMYGITSNIARKLDKIAPEATRRRNALKLASAAYLIKREHGTKAVLSATKDKIKQKKLLDQKPISMQTPDLYVKTLKTKTKFDQNTLQIKKKIEADPSLRNFLQFGSHNIIKLTSFPKISIIIITYNQVDALKRNLNSIKSKTTYKNFEVIIVSNNQDENSEMRKFLKTVEYPVYVYEKEYSFGGMNNFGASKAVGDYLLILNDDMEVINPNWLESMLSLAFDENVGAVGAKLLFANKKLQDCGGIVWKNGNAWNYGRFNEQDDPKLNYVRDVDYISGCCLLVKKKIFDKLGGFDLRYHPAYWEDADLCFSIRKLGYRVLYQPLASLIHYEGMTQGTSTDSGIKSYQVVNQKQFEEKWASVLNTHLVDSIPNSFLERDRREGLNIFYVDHYVPEPDKDSGSLRTFNILSVLSYMKNKVTFWPDNLNHTIPYVSELQQKGIEVIYGPHDLDKFLNERKNVYDVAILTRPYISVKYIDKIKEKMPKCKIIFDTTDLHFLRMNREAAIENKGPTTEAKLMKKLELSMMNKSDITILTSPVESHVLHEEDDSLKFAILPNIHSEIEEQVKPFEGRKNIMFLGGFQHPPNADAVKFFLKEIWPLIKQKIPDAKFFIVGSNPKEDVLNLSSDDIVVTGFVKDLQPYYDECKVMIVPLRYGAGIKGKITQSLSKGLPVVTTPVGSEGTELVNGKHCVIAETPEEFAEKTIQVYNDEKLWAQLSKNGMNIAQDYSAEKARACFEAMFSCLWNE